MVKHIHQQKENTGELGMMLWMYYMLTIEFILELIVFALLDIQKILQNYFLTYGKVCSLVIKIML